MMFPALPKQATSPLAPVNFAVGNNMIPIPTAIPLLPSTLVPSFKPTEHRKPQKPCNSAEDRRRKREERLAKNRESANKSRLRRKQNLSGLTEEVSSLKVQLQTATTKLVACQAENKSLKEQNSFLRSLISPQQVQQPEQQQLAQEAGLAGLASSAPVPCPKESGFTGSSRASTAIMFAVVLSCSFLSNPFDFENGSATTDSSTHRSGRVLLSTDSHAGPPQHFHFPGISGSVSMPHMTIPHVPASLFSQRVFESVMVNVLSLGCCSVLLLTGVLLFQQCSFAGNVLPIFCTDKTKPQQTKKVN
jgi:hypothetical protein